MINEILNNNIFEINIKQDTICIKNYKEIQSINNNKINIVLNNKLLSIVGIDLIIIKMDKYDLIIKGKVKGIEFISE